MVTIIDPPSGWKYGFPKPIPQNRLADSKVWLIEQGYPESLIKEYGEHFYCRYWEKPENEIESNSQSSDILIKLKTRLSKIGIEVEFVGNIPWIYLNKINGKVVKEKFMSKHGFTVAFYPVKNNEENKLTDITEIFKLIRKYK